MKSLKSRLRRQDAPGSASSGAAAAAAASAVSPAARARSGLPALPSRGALSGSEARARLRRPRRLLPPAGAPRWPGDAGNPPLRCPRASPGPFLAPLVQVSQLLLLRNQIAPSFSIRCFWVVSNPRPFPGEPRGLPCSPLLLCSRPAPRGPRRAPFRPRGCGPGRGFAPRRHPGGQDSGPGATRRGLRTSCESETRSAGRYGAGWTPCAGRCLPVTRKV